MPIISNNLLVKNLVEYGLSDKEAKMYLALLELEVGTVNEAAKAAGVNRSSAYVVLESLKEKGLISVAGDKKIQHYIATSPEALLYSAESRAQAQESIKNKIADIVPELKALHKDTKQKPKVYVFEGMNGLMASFQSSLKNKEKFMRSFSSAEKIPDAMAEYIRRRTQLGIKMRGIYLDNKQSFNLIKMLPKTDEFVVIPNSKYTFDSNLAIYDDKIGYISPQNGGYSIIIENQDMADILKIIFDLAFSGSKGLSKKRV